jgi:cell fate regulator YaaT (PSP1 superfamily)
MSCIGCSFNNSASDQSVDVFDWVNDLPDTTDQSDIVEVKFKTTRKEFFKNDSRIPLKRGDKIVVATMPGHDVGEVTLTGYLADKQFARKIKNPQRYSLNTIYRKATENDIEKLESARKREKPTMIRARQVANELGLAMKIGDVEFRGDNNKAIFYYIAESRVDFRELIKVYAREFHVKIEMKQIGARQEAGLVGGIGSCGRELCCSSWRTDFSSISTDAALKQGLSPAAQKMAGACGKLKCCLLYELDVYIEAQNEFPRELLDLETSKGIARPFKTDYLKKEIWYNLVETMPGNSFKLSLKEVKDIIQKNKRGIKPEIIINTENDSKEATLEVSLDERLDRFDHKKKTNRKPRKNRNNFKRQRAQKKDGNYNQN